MKKKYKREKALDPLKLDNEMLQRANQELRRELSEVRLSANEVLKENQRILSERSLLDNSRAGKLLRKGKEFIVVAIDEPYYPQAYRLIRQSEVKKGTWTKECEARFVRCISDWFAK
jgi:hypothetical protein